MYSCYILSSLYINIYIYILMFSEVVLLYTNTQYTYKHIAYYIHICSRNTMQQTKIIVSSVFEFELEID